MVGHRAKEQSSFPFFFFLFLIKIHFNMNIKSYLRENHGSIRSCEQSFVHVCRDGKKACENRLNIELGNQDDVQIE